LNNEIHIDLRFAVPKVGIGCLMLSCVALFFSSPVFAQSQILIGSLTAPEGGAISVARGSTVILTVSVDSPVPASGLNATLQLPPGLTFSSVQGDAGMVPGGAFTVLGTALPDNRASVLVYSDTDTFLGTSGVVARITLSAASDAPLGAFPITVLTSRAQDIKSFEVFTPRGIGSLDGESFSNTAIHTTVTINIVGSSVFSDSTLQSDIRTVLAGLGADPGGSINGGELKNVGFTTYVGDSAGYTDLNGLQYATDLTSLSLEMNDIESIQPLSTLTNLVTLKLSGNTIQDLSPLANLTNLETLELAFNDIDDLSALSGLTGLTTLILSGNWIYDISPLASLTGLVELQLDDNLISDLTPLTGLTGLNVLYLDWNWIGDISALVSNAGLASGDVLTLEMNPMDSSTICSDLSVLIDSPRLVSVTHNVTACGGVVDIFPDDRLEAEVRKALVNLGADPGVTIEASELVGVGFTLLVATNKGIRNLSGLEYATDLDTLSLKDNFITDLSPLAGLTNLTILNLTNNRITNPAALVGLDNLVTLFLTQNLIGDVSALAEITSLTKLVLNENIIHDFSPLQSLPLRSLFLDDNQIVDISPIATMSTLIGLHLENNFIGDIDGIVMNGGLGNGDNVYLRGNPLNAMAVCESIETLESLGVIVWHDETPCSDMIDRFEPDANADQAKLIEPGQFVTDLSLIDLLPDTDDVDWSKFVLTLGAQVAIESVAGALEPVDAEITTTLYPEDLSSAIAESSDSIVVQLGAGTYYIKSVEANGLFISDYAVRVSADYHESGGGDDIAANATPISIGQSSDSHTLTGGEIQSGVIASFTMDIDPGWTTDSQWAYGIPTGGGGESFGNADPTAGHTGNKVYGVNLDGDYTTAIGGPWYLTTGAIDCSLASNVTLDFYRWLNTYFQPFVYATVEVSTDGSIWSTIWDNGTSTISDSAWTYQSLDISSYADGQPTVFIRWGHEVADNGANAYSGWNIDDVRITGDIERPSNDVDWFTFTIGSPRYLQMSTATLFGNSKIEFFGPNDSTQPISQHFVSDDETLFFSRIEPGQYFIRVSEFPTEKGFDYRADVPAYSLLVEDQATPDKYEDDDSYERAMVVNLDPIVAGGKRTLKQTHNFHDTGDEDWCVMVVPSAEFHPSIELTDLGLRSNPIIEVYADDATTLLAIGSGTIHIDFNTVDNETFYIRVRNADPNVFGIGTAYGISGNGGTEIGGSVVGIISDPNGNPAPGIRLTIPSNDASKPDIRSTISASDGFYLFGNVPLGQHIATYPSTCGVELEVLINVQSANEHNVPVHMEGCPDPVDVFVNVDISPNANENGTSPRPFSNLESGVNMVTPGGTVHLRGVKTNEIFTGGMKISKKMKLLAENINGVSPVVIGQP